MQSTGGVLSTRNISSHNTKPLRTWSEFINNTHPYKTLAKNVTVLSNFTLPENKKIKFINNYSRKVHIDINFDRKIKYI